MLDPSPSSPNLDARIDGLPPKMVEAIYDAVRPGHAHDDAGDAADLTAALPAPVDVPSDYIGCYRILEKIDEGGMGTVYKAEQREPVRRIVALKVIKPGMDTREVIARFEAERQALALMSHPHVAQVFEAGTTDRGRPYFAMEYVPGVPLTRYCDDNKLTIRERLELFVPICHAVQHAHQKGIIHRDLKPSNILVTMFDGKPVPKVIDFGIAKATSQALTQRTLCTRTGSLLGTPEYMSPEQAMTSGLDVDTRTDVYSLGVILYELLTGALPFDLNILQPVGAEGIARVLRDTEPSKPSTRLRELGGDRAAAASAAPVVGPSRPTTLAQVAKCRRADPRALCRALRGDLDVIVLKAIEKDRTRRYETANALATDVRRYLDGDAVLAQPPTALYLLQRRLRPHRRALTIAAAFVLLMAVLFVVFGIRIHRDENKAWVLTGPWEQKEKFDWAYVAVEVPPVPGPAATEGTNLAAEHVKRGNELLRDGNLPAAEEQFALALKVQPDSADAAHGQGMCYIKRGDITAGIASLEKAAGLYNPPGRASAYTAAVANLEKNPLRAAMLLEDYLARTGRTRDEQLFDLMGAALERVGPERRQDPEYLRLRESFRQYNPQPPATAPVQRKRRASDDWLFDSERQ